MVARYGRYRRRFYRKRRSYARRPKQSKFNYYANTAVKALSLATRVASMVNVEKKFADNASGPTTLAFPTAADDPILCPTAVAQGDTEQTRDGSKIRVKSLHLRGHCSWTSAAATPQRIRVIMIRSKVMDGDYPALSHLLKDATNFDSFRLIDESYNNYVLYDKIFCLSDQKPEIQFTYNKSCSWPVKYIGTAANEASSGWGSVMIYAFTDQITSNFPQIDIDTRIRYVDN